MPAILPVGSRVLLDVETTDPYLIVSYFWDETWGKLLCYVGESESESEVFDFGLCKYEGICEDMEKDGWYPFEKFLSKTPPV